MITGITKIPYLINKHGAREIIAITQSIPKLKTSPKIPSSLAIKTKKIPCREIVLIN